MNRRPTRIQAAAVCLRADERGCTEVMLVRTRRRGRWTFPKGGVNVGESTAAAAGREAAEEAGVGGRVETGLLGAYTTGSGTKLIAAHRLEVTHTGADHESGRDPQWVSVEHAGRMLSQHRRRRDRRELQRVLRTAVAGWQPSPLRYFASL